ncbi:MAG: hypothetical protein L0Z70_08050, partial [Chloroflexi bacterium]|nr:hypothetical protein [Chloroflexota bacterium]
MGGTKIRLMGLRALAALWLLLFNLLPSLPARAQDPTPHDRARIFLQGLTPEERVGQLFLVSFKGMQAGSDTQIYDLISSHHVGGVVFTAGNDNFISGEDAVIQTLNLNRQLQLNYWAASQDPLVNANGETYTPEFIPLFLSLAQEGDGYPYDQLLSGVTRLPNQMAIGAAWDAALAEQAGEVLGKELSVLGFNLLLGPSVDVLEASRQEASSGLGTRTFGGDPYWVAKMGQAFIRGVHQGSRGDLAVAASHYPGIGSADRRPEEEVATVRKSLEQLQNFDLSPFFAITGNAPSEAATADALLVSHIRYQGFQGNIRATTRPVSFDEQAFSSLMSLPPLASWREAGGIMVSDDLGSRAVRRFYDLTNPGELFDGRRVALTAFLAGNDLLILGDITSGEDPDAYTTTLSILEFFAQKYREDPAFAQRVDASVERILALKYRLFGDFNLTAVQKPLEGIVELGLGEQVAFDVARRGAALISPSLAELDDTAPNQNDRVVFISDTRTARQCSACPEEKLLARDALEQAVLRLYGPRAGRLVTPSLLRSYTYDDLTRLLDGDDSIYQLEIDMRRAQWLVFATLDVDRDERSSQALQRFLAERLDLLQQKRVVIFAFNAPTFLDATDVSKLSAYYGLFSKGPTFVDQAARLLFHELRPEGALPISAPGVGYDLISATMPDPLQTIPLALDLPTPETGGVTATPDPALQPQFEIGDAIPVRAGVILDHNGHPVP